MPPRFSSGAPHLLLARAAQILEELFPGILGELAAGGATAGAVLTAGVAGLAAGSMAMAAGEFVSVSSQVDVERADRAKEEREWLPTRTPNWLS